MLNSEERKGKYVRFIFLSDPFRPLTCGVRSEGEAGPAGAHLRERVGLAQTDYHPYVVSRAPVVGAHSVNFYEPCSVQEPGSLTGGSRSKAYIQKRTVLGGLQCSRRWRWGRSHALCPWFDESVSLYVQQKSGALPLRASGSAKRRARQSTPGGQTHRWPESQWRGRGRPKGSALGSA